MLKGLINLVKSKMHSALGSAHAFLMLPFVKNFISASSVALKDGGQATTSTLSILLDILMEIVNTFFYIIAKYILLFVDLCQVVIYKIAGIDADLDNLFQMPIFRFLLKKEVLTILGSLLIVGFVLLIVATIVALVKSEYQNAVEGDGKDPKVTAYKTVGKSLISLFMMVITPFIIIIVIVFSSVMLTSINNVLNPDGTENATLGGQVFVSAAYNANKYREYAANGQRIPILYDFDDPYQLGTWQDYTSEELAKIYGSWDGLKYYENGLAKNYDSFASTLTYRDNKIYNSSSYTNFESFVSTPEQYYVMADFIDYAMAHDVKFYIKNARDEEVDWRAEVAPNVKLTDGVYDELNQTITLTYKDESNLSPYDNYYNVVFETGNATATTPIQDAANTIAMIMGLFSADSEATKSIAGGTLSESEVSLQNSALTNVANQISSSISSGLAGASGDPNVTFRILERLEGSQNIVKWKTEKAIYGNQEFTVYELKKIYKNQLTGINETKATVKVAKKDDSLNSKYYVLKEEPSITGYYEYTNITIDYYNDGKYFLDTLEPVYTRVTWPEKLYNDLSVIYCDIDFDNYINYDNWADALGTYFNAQSGTNDASVSTFATTLVHPLGLIMAELFMGIAIEGEENSINEFNFTTNYLNDAINAIILSVGGQFEYKNIKDQITYFVKLFNAQFTPVIESLKKIENFDVYANDESSVEAYVYKAYLSSIMLATDYSDYLIKIAETILRANRLLELMSYGTGSIVRDSNGNIVYKVEYLEDLGGNKVPLMHDSGASKVVYTSYGQKAYTMYYEAPDPKEHSWIGDLFAGIGDWFASIGDWFKDVLNIEEPVNGDLSQYGNLVPKKDTKYSIRNERDKNDESIVKPVYYVYIQEIREYVPASSLVYNGNEYIDVYKQYIEDLKDYVKELEDKEEEKGKFNYADGKVDNNKKQEWEEPWNKYIAFYEGKIKGEDAEGNKNVDVFQNLLHSEFLECYNNQPNPPSKKSDMPTMPYRAFIYDYFEPYFYFNSYNGYFYVYEPEDGDTTKDKTKVVTKAYINVEDKTKEDYEDLIENFSNLAFYTIGAVKELSEYYVYEAELVPETSYDYLTYGKLSKTFRDLVDEIIIEMENDFKALKMEPSQYPLYFTFLQEYKADNPEMKDVMAAKSIASSVADSYYRNYNQIKRNLEYYELELSEAQDRVEKQRYENLLRVEYNKYYRVKKNYIIRAIEYYVSNKITSGFTVIVNGHPYDVSQGITTDNIMEIVYGNNLTYDALINAIKNKQPYNRLSDFNKQAIKDFKGFLGVYSAKLAMLLAKSGGEYVLFGGSVDDDMLDMASRFYSAYSGVYVNLTNRSGKELKEETKEAIIKGLTLYVQDIETIFTNYIAGNKITQGTKIKQTEDVAYNSLAFIIEFNMIGSGLKYVDEQYAGIVDNNGEGFGVLRKFLTDFGNICFDLARKSNIGSIREESTNNFLEFIKDFANSLNKRLEDVDLGSSISVIPVVEDSSVLVKADGSPVLPDTKFAELSNQSKAYIYQIYELYTKLSADYEEVLSVYEAHKKYTERYINNRYAMYEDSFVFDDGLEEYLNYFRYNVEVMPAEDEDVAEFIQNFKDKYVYIGYEGGLKELDDRIFYYNQYLNAFSEMRIGTSGVYFENLSDLQQKVLIDMAAYYLNAYNEYKNANSEAYEENVKNRGILYNFIFNGATLSNTESEENIDFVAKQTDIHKIFDANINLLNLYNMLGYVGIEFDVNKSLADYRLNALNMLSNFEERAGETGAQIQARYLCLLYIFCADYEISADGQTRVVTDENTKQTVLKLAGIQNKAEELLVGLEYEIDFTEYTTDEEHGGLYIICTFNEETLLYEPFVFANAPDKYGTPYSNYYSSEDGRLKYYPIIAKGVIDPSGKPTAIREVDGFVEFYREDVVQVNASYLNIDMYYLSEQKVQRNYSLFGTIVNGISKLFTKKTLAEHLIDNFPVISVGSNLGFAYGTEEQAIYHLDRGGFILNYMFYENSGIQLNCLYNIREVNTIVLTLGTLLIAFSIINALFGVIRNLYEIMILVLIHPGVCAMYPLDSSLQDNWRKEFIDKMLVMFGYIIAINGFFIIIRIVDTMDINIFLNEGSKEALRNTFVFGRFNLDTIISNLMEIAMFLVAVTLINTLPKMFSKMAGGGNVTEKGTSAKLAVKTNIQEATYFSSGYAIEDMILDKTNKLKSMPIIGSDSRAKRQEAKQIAANKQAVKQYNEQLKSRGISDDVVSKATKAYEDSLNREIEAARQRRNKDAEARKARIAKRKKRLAEQSDRYDGKDGEFTEQKKPKICPYCKTILNKKSKQCPICGKKV